MKDAGRAASLAETASGPVDDRPKCPAQGIVATNGDVHNLAATLSLAKMPKLRSRSGSSRGVAFATMLEGVRSRCDHSCASPGRQTGTVVLSPLVDALLRRARSYIIPTCGPPASKAFHPSSTDIVPTESACHRACPVHRSKIPGCQWTVDEARLGHRHQFASVLGCVATEEQAISCAADSGGVRFEATTCTLPNPHRAARLG